jgi:DNA modification methylase/predicted RNA-binding Zn-ribbon protein involved in translation (DUF1610 family)
MEGDLQKVTEFVKKYGKPYDPKHDEYSEEPFATDVRAGKASAIYNAHPYHTKVPPRGIEPFILHYTENGDLILDPFCGSGMTGVAALKLQRNTILTDLSEICCFIAENYCSELDKDVFEQVATKVEESVLELVSWLYETNCKRCGQKSTLEFVIWSDEFECPRCSSRFLLWDVAVTPERDVKRVFLCPNCGRELRKQNCRRIGTKPVKLVYSCPRCGRREGPLDKMDYSRLEEIERRWKRIHEDGLRPNSEDSFWPIDAQRKPLWLPALRMPEGSEARRNDKIGITHVHHFYTTRNLWALSKLWNEISKITDIRIRKELQFIFTGLNPTLVSRLTRYNFGRAGNSPVSGTLYVPSFNVERNVLSAWHGKFSNVKDAINSSTFKAETIISCQSATNMANIPNDSVDYVFTDPPFGGNLMYSELNFLWESWLGRFTKAKEEAVISESMGKGIAEYKDLMTKSFKEIYRVLKPGRWMTMVFHNSDGRVWQAIQEGLAEAGFVIGMIGTFDKKQRSFKQVTSSGAVGYDVVVNCYKPKATVKNGIEGKTTEEAIIGFLADKLSELPLSQCDERTARMLHSKTIGFFMQQNKPLVKLSFEDFQKILKKNFREIDEYWYLPYQRPKSTGQKKLFGFISNEAEAIEWLEAFLRRPRKYGDIVPDFFKALGPNQLKKDLQQILEENFIEEKGLWRNPTTIEKERLVKKVSDQTARQIDQYLKGSTELTPTDAELCKWIEFCYNNGLYQEGAKLFQFISENAVDPGLFRNTKKIAEVCKLKSWE